MLDWKTVGWHDLQRMWWHLQLVDCDEDRLVPGALCCHTQSIASLDH